MCSPREITPADINFADAKRDTFLYARPRCNDAVAAVARIDLWIAAGIATRIYVVSGTYTILVRNKVRVRRSRERARSLTRRPDFFARAG